MTQEQMDREQYGQFLEDYQQGKSSIIFEHLPADLETPISVYLKLAAKNEYAFLLESVEGGVNKGRYSFIGIEPDLLWKSQGNQAFIANRNPSIVPHSPSLVWQKQALPVLDSLRALTKACHIDIPANIPTLAAGLIGYLSYDSIRLMENIPDGNPDDLGLPEGLFMRPSLTAVFDTVTDQLILAAPIWYDASLDPQNLWDQAKQYIENAQIALNQPTPGMPQRLISDTLSGYDNPNINAMMPPANYQAMVEKAKEYILAGDIFQVVLSQRFEADYHSNWFDYYRALRHTNPAPFLFYLQFKDFAISGSSPEILVRCRDGQVTIRPLAGTRPRGKDPLHDAALEQELLNDPKECAEHLMLLDLGRNDVGKIAKLASVEVDGQFMIERYSHVMHIVSNVMGKKRDDCDAIDALFAGFPAGTVSGAPKVRAMEIIDELEPIRRGIYAGCVGYFAADGSMDSCIALRTAILKDDKIYIQAGAGIVADSDPVMEQKECEAKAGALITALMRVNHMA